MAISAQLTKHSWLRRTFELSLPEGRCLLYYEGQGTGFESVSVDGKVVAKGTHWWIVPFFDFPIGSHNGRIEVRLWPWLTIRSFALAVDGEVLYREGRNAI
jgi:hypothetical protein